jgi:hypothetical protein
VSLLDIVEPGLAGLIRINQSLAFSLKSDQSPFKRLLFQSTRRSIGGLPALVILLDEDLRVAQRFVHRLP